MNGAREMPKYKCHKEVHALKIKDIVFDWEFAREQSRESDGSATITPYKEGYAPFTVKYEFVSKHLIPLLRFKPLVQGFHAVRYDKSKIIGGYFVVYADGYESFSPEKAFEDDYTRLD